MNYDPREFAAEVKERFGIDELTPEQAWIFVKLVKHGRLRCRNNAALNNYMRKSFGHLTFDQVEKRKQPTQQYPEGEPYEGLRIAWRDHARQAQQDDDDEIRDT